jgi:phage baseplate assembly protein W
MLAIRDNSGVDLTANPPSIVVLRAPDTTGLPYQLQFRVIEDSQVLPFSYVSAIVNWNDGSLPEEFPYTLASSGTLTVTTQRRLALGDHSIEVIAQNYAAPVPDTVLVNFEVIVNPPVTFAEPRRLLYGPILPSDQGFPNPSQWSFNTGFDSNILASSVKMLLITNKNERLMEPEYGTRLRDIIFEPMGQGVEAMAQQEIVDALNRWEPRVKLQFLQVIRNDDRSITVNAQFESKISFKQFVTSITFQQ